MRASLSLFTASALCTLALADPLIELLNPPQSDSITKPPQRRATPEIPSVLPGNWTSFGCYTDISTSRTLAAISVTNSTSMTVEMCIGVCAASDYLYAGVEFGQECYCDSAIQVPGIQAPLTDCTTPCVGNTSETCGGGNRLNIFTSNEQVPVIVQNVGQWVYSGCFTDSIDSRTLTTGINIPAGVTAETCTATCQTAGFSLAGVENGRECWCANSLAQTAQHVSDNDCRAVCTSNHTEYCGNANRIAIYNNLSSGSPTSPTECTQTDITNFTLSAVYNIPPENGPSIVPLKVVLVELVPSVVWGILSACSLCCSDWPTFSLQNSVFMPRSITNPVQLMVSSAPGDGESPNFVASNPAFPGFQSYCAMTGTGSLSSKSILAFGGKSDAFSLCVNKTQPANGRLDVVYSPVTGHAHYDLSGCSPVTIVVN